MAEIPPAVLRQLNAGTTESLNLVEWLAVDIEKLAKAAGYSAGLDGTELATHARKLRGLGVMQRTGGMGAALYQLLENDRGREKALGKLASHMSDSVRTWACYALVAHSELPLETRLELVRPFATDSHMGVREIAWMAIRPHLAMDLELAFRLLVPWTTEADPNLRRFASEATRPRGVWCAHISELKNDPEPGLAILEPLRSDPHIYVRRSVANWLNDASKTRPDWVRKITARWLRESKTKETAWTVNHATRTLRKG